MRETVQKRFGLTELFEITGVDQRTVIGFIQQEWIHPAGAEEFDQEDIARIRLIQELRSSFCVNDEAIPVILHLMDQLYYLRHQMKFGNEQK